jgi:hypothetical protein
MDRQNDSKHFGIVEVPKMFIRGTFLQNISAQHFQKKENDTLREVRKKKRI